MTPRQIMHREHRRHLNITRDLAGRYNWRNVEARPEYQQSLARLQRMKTKYGTT